MQVQGLSKYSAFEMRGCAQQAPYRSLCGLTQDLLKKANMYFVKNLTKDKEYQHYCLTPHFKCGCSYAKYVINDGEAEHGIKLVVFNF